MINLPTLKGAFVRYDDGILGTLPNIIIFQFNPETMTRNPYIERKPQESGIGKNQKLQVVSAPSESISFTLRLDATDQLARDNPIAKQSGILPALSSLELLMHPKERIELVDISKDFFKYKPESLPLVLFVWGVFRVLPVVITNLSITEMEYDARLNPTRAEVSVTMDVITPPNVSDFAERAYLYTQSIKKGMAALNLANSAELLGSMMF